MGAYEFQLEEYPTPTETPVPTPTSSETPTHTLTPTREQQCDINDDGTIDARDLLLLLRDWQRVSPP